MVQRFKRDEYISRSDTLLQHDRFHMSHLNPIIWKSKLNRMPFYLSIALRNTNKRKALVKSTCEI
jgi:hypothetical protein